MTQMNEVELLVAMSRTTLMSGYFVRPIEPPEWMRLLFPDEEELKCVSIGVYCLESLDIRGWEAGKGNCGMGQ